MTTLIPIPDGVTLDTVQEHPVGIADSGITPGVSILRCACRWTIASTKPRDSVGLHWIAKQCEADVLGKA